MTLFLMVGLPGAGKTFRARELASTQDALRLTPDEWMLPLFGAPEAGGKRDTLEGLLIWTAIEALRHGTSVVLDFGFWARDERSALRWLAGQAGATCHVVYLPIGRTAQLARIARRQAIAAHQTFPLSEAELDRWRKTFQAPDAPELAGTILPSPPPGWPGWATWACHRWPTLPAEMADARLRERPSSATCPTVLPVTRRRRPAAVRWDGRGLVI